MSDGSADLPHFTHDAFPTRRLDLSGARVPLALAFGLRSRISVDGPGAQMRRLLGRAPPRRSLRRGGLRRADADHDVVKLTLRLSELSSVTSSPECTSIRWSWCSSERSS